MVTGRWHLEHLGEEKYEAQFTSFANSTPLKRRVNPEDVASAVVWLIDGADAVTGQVLVVDAGRLHRRAGAQEVKTCTARRAPTRGPATRPAVTRAPRAPRACP